jgi:hypothetical protein
MSFEAVRYASHKPSPVYAVRSATFYKPLLASIFLQQTHHQKKEKRKEKEGALCPVSLTVVCSSVPELWVEIFKQNGGKENKQANKATSNQSKHETLH